MTVVVDIGNARIKWGCLHDGVLSSFGESVHVEDVDRALNSVAESVAGQVDRVVGTNVAGEPIAARLDEMVGKRWGVKPQWLTSRAQQLGVTCGYADPQRLGADRWVAVIAAHARSSGAVCVIDAGTAATFDAVDARGKHLGGLIMAGPRLAATALRRETSNIGRTTSSEEAPQGLALMGTSTDEAVAHGAMLGVAAAVDRALRVISGALQTEPLVLLTGGQAKVLLPWLESKVQYREHLVLEGLARIANES